MLNSQPRTRNTRRYSAAAQLRPTYSRLLLNGAYKKLEELRDQGKIPNTTIPVLQDRLSAEVCICGETLELGHSGGEKRRAHIQKLIDNSRRADEIQEIITTLYFGERAGPSAWLEDYKKVVRRRDGIQDLRDEAGRKYRTLELQLDALPDTDVQGLRAVLREYKEQRDRCLSRRAGIETQLSALRRERETLESERNRLLREQKKGSAVF